MLIDTHAHLDAAELLALGGAASVSQQARAAGVARVVWPAVSAAHWAGVQAGARALGDGYALGIHPLYVPQTQPQDVSALAACLAAHAKDPHLLAVGEIGLDFWVPALCTPEMRDTQQQVFCQQLALAERMGLPVIVHVRRSADTLLKHLRPWTQRCQARYGRPLGGIAHAFNGSEAQAHAFIQLGFKLGFGGAVTYERAQNLRRLVTTLPLASIVLETDSPDMPPQWLYKTKTQREGGQPQGINTPAELPRIAQVIADLRGISLAALADASTANACVALPKLKALIDAA